MSAKHLSFNHSARPLHIGITCFPTFGGSGIIATEIGLQLARRGHRVHFICYDAPSRLDRFADNVRLHEVENREYPLFENLSTYPLALTSKMVEVATAERLDLLHVHYAVPHATSAYLARQILGPRSPKIVTTLHGTDITLVGNDPSFLPITRFSIMQSDALTTPSAYLKEATYRNLDVPREIPIEVVPNFVDTERYRPPAQKSWDAVSPLFRPPSGRDKAVPRVLVHTSNFRPLKRVGDVLRIFERVRGAVPARLILIGDGPERARIETLAHSLGLADEVCFLGEQLNFLEVLQHADVFLLPSETESFGLAALEALACGVPVVASRAGGLPEVISEGETGFLDAVGDIEGMAAHVLTLLRDDALHARFSRAARQKTEERWSREPQVALYEALYFRLLDGGAAGQVK